MFKARKSGMLLRGAGDVLILNAREWYINSPGKNLSGNLVM